MHHASLDNLGNSFIFPAPTPSYTASSYKRHLCWIPWNPVISARLASDVKSGDGIPCLWFPAPKAATVMVFFHANAEDLGMLFGMLKHFRDQFRVNLLALEYPGYGLLRDLPPSEEGMYEVALTVLRYLVDEVSVRYSQIILLGRSLGSGPACFLAAKYPVGGLILVSPFCSIKAAMHSVVGRVLALPFAERFPNHKIIGNVSCPTLFIHGERDLLIPPEHSLRLFKRCRARKLFVTPPNMEHNSNLFGDKDFLAVPAIHFFGFPGYQTSSPPRLPSNLFEASSNKRSSSKEGRPEMSGSKARWCDCPARSDPHHAEVPVCVQEHASEEVAVRFPAASATAGTGLPPAPAAEHSSPAPGSGQVAEASSPPPRAPQEGGLGASELRPGAVIDRAWSTDGECPVGHLGLDGL